MPERGETRIGDREMHAGVARRWASRVAPDVVGRLQQWFRGGDGLAADWVARAGGMGFAVRISRDGYPIVNYELALAASESGLTLAKRVASHGSGFQYRPAAFTPEQPGRAAHATTAGDVLFDLARTLDTLANVRRM